MSQRNTSELEQGLKLLQKGFLNLCKAINQKNSNEFTCEYMHFRKIIYDMCNQHSPHNYSRHLYNKYREFLEEYITRHILPSFREKIDEFLLREAVKEWESYKIIVFDFSSLFSPLHLFVKYNRLPTLNEVGMRCFHNMVYKEFMCHSLRDAVIVQINRERGGEQIVDPALLKNVVGIYLEFDMECYEEGFQSAMLEATDCYYSRKAANWIRGYSSPGYMLKAEECLNLEKGKIAVYYLHPSSEKKLLEKVESILLIKYESRVLECFHLLLRDKKLDDLSRMFRLFNRIDICLMKMGRIFRRHIAGQGISLIKYTEQQVVEAENASNKKAIAAAAQVYFVRNVIGLYCKYFHYVKKLFMNNCILRESLREGFEDFCNKLVAGRSIGELFITFCDIMLRNRSLTYELVQGILENVVKILAYISNKDMLAEFYTKKLAERLLNQSYKSENVVHEKFMLSKLKIEFGLQFTYRMEGMLSDLASTTATQLRFEHYLKENPLDPLLGMGLSVKVLTSGFWPRDNSLNNLLCPVEMTRCVQVFEEFYRREKMDRKLKWIFSRGTCEMIGRFDSHEIEITTTPWQACALLLFNASERLAYSDFKSQLNLTDKYTVRLLQSLSCSESKILNKVPNTQIVTQTDYFEVNAKISNELRKIKIPAPVAQEKEKVPEAVENARSLQIEASIVRIMKSKKVLPHSDLVMQCIENLKHIFIPNKKAIKKRIEDLIMRDYLERDSENPSIYRYIS